MCSIHPDGWRFVGLFFAITVALMIVHPFLGWIGFMLTLWCAYFFRSPSRVSPQNEQCLVSPADGKIVAIVKSSPPTELGLGEEVRTRISVFLNVFDVHVNRIPESGVVKKILYHPGKFFNASLDKASEHNERNVVVMETLSGHTVAFVQIAGLIARRIRCDIKEGDRVERGQLYGLIRFGSRVDIYLPVHTDPIVLKGQYVIGGETILAHLT